MSAEMPEISFKDMLLVPGGPPESVWERALDAAFTHPDQDDVPDDAFAESAGPGMVLDPAVDFLPNDDHAVDSHPTTHDDSSAGTAWDDGNGGPDGGHDAGDGIPDSGHGLTDSGDGFTGTGDDAGY